MKKKIKVIIQHDSMDCGVACLAIKPGDGSLVYSGLELFKTEDDVIFE